MARPQRNNVDYYPLYCKEGKGMYYIENKYGNDGYTVWNKLLTFLAQTNFHYLNLNSKADIMFVSSKCRVTEDMLFEIIEDLVNLGEFNEELWKESKVLWNQKFIDSIQDAYRKKGEPMCHF